MKKLVVFPDINNKYSQIILGIKSLNLKNIEFISQNNLNLKIIKKFDVVVFGNLEKDFIKEN